MTDEFAKRLAEIDASLPANARPRYYSRQGRPLTTMEWAQSFENMTQEARIVGLTTIDDECYVSTVWLGLDHSFLHIGPPLIFETMIFGGQHDMDQWRYATEEQAVAGHAEAVRVARGEVDCNYCHGHDAP